MIVAHGENVGKVVLHYGPEDFGGGGGVKEQDRGGRGTMGPEASGGGGNMHD